MRTKSTFMAVLVATGMLAGCGGEQPPAAPTGATAARPSETPAARPTSLTIAAAGDLLVHEGLTAQAAADAAAAGRAGHDFTTILAAVTPILREADLAICHMEQPLAAPEGPFTGWPLFSAPPQLADAAKAAGFDTCSTASNHSLDTDVEGVTRTLDNLDRVGLAHAGTARSAAEAHTPTIVDVRGVPVAHLSYSSGFNGIPLPDGMPWLANQLDPDAILAAAQQARAAGAEIVIVSLHWGTEYQVIPDEQQLTLAERLLAAPEIDLIVGHHVHVVQPLEKIGDKWVAYGMGNLTARFPDGSPENTQDAIVPTFTFTEVGPGRWQVSEVTAVPTRMEYYPQSRVVSLPAALVDGDLPGDLRDRYQTAFERITEYVDLRGALDDGLELVQPRESDDG